jgi:hypothetical protein
MISTAVEVLREQYTPSLDSEFKVDVNFHTKQERLGWRPKIIDFFAPKIGEKLAISFRTFS